MKIIRKRRGFTTNSSSAADWVVPVPTAADFATNAYLSATTSNQVTTTAAPAQNQVLKNNVGSIAGVLCAVAGLFVVERLVRGFMKRKRGSE